MSAIDQCRSAALGGHVLRCEGCGSDRGFLQLVPQPALPEVPEQRGAALARGAAGRSAAGGVLPRGLHAAGAHCRHRLPEQGRALRAAVRHRRRDAADASPPIRSTWARASARRSCCTPGARRSPTTRMCTASCPAAASQPTANAGWRAGPGSSCRCACSRGCSAAASSKNSNALHRAGRLRFFGEHAALAEAARSRAGLRRCASASGSSTPSAHWPVPQRCWPICRATRTASRSPTAGSRAWTSAA